MFAAFTSRDADLSSWDVSQVTDMSGMFSYSLFNGNISSWDVSQVTDMSGMFNGDTSFNQDLSEWNVSQVTGMSGMFEEATSFNQPLNDWNVSQVTDMSYMFSDATSFNQPLSSWNVSQVASMNNMFALATAFDQNLGNWYVVPADTAYATSEGNLNVTTISAQNSVLGGHSPNYGIGSGGDSASFNITDSNTLMFKAAPSARDYTVNVTASGNAVFEDGNNWRELAITVTGEAPADTTPPVITLVGANPDSLPAGFAYADPGVTCTDDTDPNPSLTSNAAAIITASTPPGTYTVTYTCTDSLGQHSHCHPDSHCH